MSVITDICDAVVEKLNADFSGRFTAVRTYQPSYSLEDLATLRVTVIPRSIEISNLSRTSQTWECAVDIGVQRQAFTVAECDVLANLVDDIVLAMTHVSLGRGQFVKIVNDPVVVPEKLDSKHVYMSVVTVTYRVKR